LAKPLICIGLGRFLSCKTVKDGIIQLINAKFKTNSERFVEKQVKIVRKITKKGTFAESELGLDCL
ncbi:hypothetical protein, partial [Streptococcus suis]|uniref:hypothetical protein n=1 Tax=Streptococcus suis TaxID=1307 RepID=UPI0004A613B2